MLVNPPPHLSHALSSMHRECVYTYNKWEEKKNYLMVVAPGGLIGPSVAT